MLRRLHNILLWGAELNLSFAAILVIFVVSGIGLNLAASPAAVDVYEAAIVASAHGNNNGLSAMKYEKQYFENPGVV